MPDIAELGRAFKQKYPGAYDDVADSELGVVFQQKYPGAYDDFKAEPAAPAESPKPRTGPQIVETEPAAPPAPTFAKPRGLINTSIPQPVIREKPAEFGEDTSQPLISRETAQRLVKDLMTFTPLLAASKLQPAAEGAAEHLTGITTPTNIGIGGAVVASGGLGAIGPATAAAVTTAQSALSAYFAGQLAYGIGEQTPEAVDAYIAGDWDKLMKVGGGMLADGAMAALAATGAVSQAGEALYQGRRVIADSNLGFGPGEKFGAPLEPEVQPRDMRNPGAKRLEAGAPPETIDVNGEAIPVEAPKQIAARPPKPAEPEGNAPPAKPGYVDGEPIEQPGAIQKQVEGEPQKQLEAPKKGDAAASPPVDEAPGAAPIAEKPAEKPGEGELVEWTVNGKTRTGRVISPAPAELGMDGAYSIEITGETDPRKRYRIVKADLLQKSAQPAEPAIAPEPVAPPVKKNAFQESLKKNNLRAPAEEPKPGDVVQLETKSIEKDPARFQFKANVGQGGAGAELRGIEKFDPEMAGVIAVWRDPANGKTYVVNGHHRLELAERTETPTITARYLEAATAKEARIKGALINIAEGRGESTDAAKIFRDGGFDEAQLKAKGISLTGKLASEGMALAKLDPHLFSKVIAGDIPPARAAVIGAGLSEHADQRALYDVVEKADKSGRRLTNDQIGEMIRLSVAGPTKTEVVGGGQGGLFGDEEVTRSLIKEKAEVSDYVRKQLTAEKRLFGTVGTEAIAGKLAERGNVIKATENQAVATEAAQALEVYDKLSTRSGPVASALETAAADLAEGKNANETKAAAYQAVREAILRESGGSSSRRAEGLGKQGPREDGAGELDSPRSEEAQLDNADQAESDARSRIKDRGTFSGTRLNAGLPVDDLADFAIIGAAKMARGARTFAEWAKQMLSDLGASLKAHLLRIYQRAGSLYAKYRASRAGSERGSLDLFDDAEVERIRKEEEGDKARLLGEQLTAQMKSGMKLKPGKRGKGPAQTNMFEETPEEAQGGLFGSERGSVNISTIGLGKFIDADLKPAIGNAARSLARVKDDIFKLIAPAARGPLAKSMQGEIRHQAAILERKMDQARAALAEASKQLMRLPVDVRFEFIDRIETGRPQGDIHLQQIADVMRTMLDEARSEVQALGTGKLQSFYENYFPHMWKDPAQAQGVFQGFFTKKPFEGPKSFLKKRTLPTFADGLAAGLEPASEDPVELVIAKLGEMQKYIMAHTTLNMMKQTKMARFVDARNGHAPTGWIKIEDAIGTVYGNSTPSISEYPNQGLWSGLQAVADALGLKQQRGFLNLGNAIGRASPTGTVKTLHGTAEDVLAHEIGHQIDWRAGSGRRFVTHYPDEPTVNRLKAAYKTLKDKSASPADRTAARKELAALKPAIAKRKEFSRQLRALADLRTAAGHSQSYTRKREEKMAQLAEMWVGARDLFAKTAPDVFREWKQFLDENPKLHDLRDIQGNTEVEQLAHPFDVGGLVIKGHWWGPEPAVALLNNYLSPGLRGHASFSAYMGVGNVMLQFQLGWSAFHAAFVSLDAMTSRFALGVHQAAHGAPLKGLRSMAVGLTPVTPFATYHAGKRITEAWDRPGTQSPWAEQMADAVAAAGGRARMNGAFHGQMTKSMLAAWRGGNVVGAGLRLPFVLTEQMARPIMEYLVPRMKLGVFAQLAEFEIERAGGAAADPAKLRAALQTAWDSVDNRLGQLVYDNLGWNRTVKDLAMASVRTVGWNLGDIRELGGGAVDLARETVNAARGKGFDLSHRSSYLPAIAVLVGLYGGLVHYLLNGERPSELLDYYYPKDGEGKRLAMPSYIKEVQHFGHDPVATVKGKIHPLLTLFVDMISNRDFFDRPIANPNDPLVERALAFAKHAASAFVPISMKGLEQNQNEGLKQKVLPFIGLPRAPKYVSDPGKGGRLSKADRALLGDTSEDDAALIKRSTR